MKKRILSFLLVLCMLVAMVPVTAAVAEETGSTESQADVEYASSYLDLYVTDGLTVLFDANTASSSMITFGEEAGKAGTWYGYTVDANGKLAASETYAANPFGGAYNAETNPLGWQKLENGGISVNMSRDTLATNYYLHFAKEWLGNAFEVELVFAPYFRDSKELSAVPMTMYQFEDGESGIGEGMTLDENGKPSISYGLISEDTATDDDGNPIAGIESFFLRPGSAWQSTSFANGANEITVYFVGDPGEVVTPISGDAGTYAKNSSTGLYAYTSAGSLTWGSVTLDENGEGSLTVSARGNAFKIVLSDEGSAYVDRVEACEYKNQNAYSETFVVGNLFGMVWHNLKGSNTWSNGFGWARWTVAKSSWESGTATPGNTNSDANKAMLIDTTTKGYDDTAYGTLDSKGITMSVVNTGSAYTLTYGGKTPLSATLDANKANEDGSYAGANFKMLQQMGGTVYGARVYAKPLTAAQRNQNHFADIAARYGLDVSAMELEGLADYKYLYAAFASVAMEGEDADALQTKLDDLIANNPTKLKTDYDKLYVQNGLIALFSAYNNDASVQLTKGVWVDKTGNGADAKFGGNLWAVNANGDGVGYTLNLAGFEADRGKMASNYLSFGRTYFYMDDITFESVIMYKPLTDGTTTHYITNFPGIQLDMVQGTTFFNAASNFNFRMGLGGYPWANHNGNNAVNIMSFAGVNSVYIGNGSNVRVNAIMNQTMVKNLEPTTAYLKFTFDGTVYSTSGPQNSEGTFARSTYDYQRNRYPAYGSYNMPDPYTLFNDVPGSAYAVRIYDRVLTDAEAKQNKLVDILAYTGYDLSKINVEDILANAQMLDAILNGGIGQTAAQIDEVIAFFNQGDVEKTVYDELYVDRGLVALYTAYASDDEGGDASLVVSGDKVTGWIDKVNQVIAPVIGSFAANSNGNGGFGTSRWTADEWNNEKASAGVNFNGIDIAIENFTVEAAISLNSLTDATGTQHNGSRTQLRVDLFALTTFIGNSGSNNHQIRGVLSNGNWSNNGGHNGNGDVIGFAGQTAGYRADTFNFVNDKINSMVFIKETNADTSIKFVYTFNASRRANTTITAAQYAQQKSLRAPTDGVLSLLNGTPGDLYAVRVYNVALTTAEQRQNKLVDLLAYTGADLTNYPTETTQLALLANLVAEKGWSFDTANLKAYLETAMANGMVKVTYTDELTGDTLTSFSAVKGDFLALPSTVGNKTVLKWNADFEEIELTEDITVSAMTINTPTASNNVSIRVDTTEGAEDVGLRFTSTLSKASYGDLTIKYGADNIKLGMLISTEAIVKGAGAFTKADLDAYAAGNAAYVDIALAGYYELAANGDYVMAGVLTNIKDATIANEVAFVSVLYIEIDTDDDGSYDTVVYGTASAAKTVAAVADAVKATIDAEDVESGLTAEAEATFNTWYAAKFPVAAE